MFLGTLLENGRPLPPGFLITLPKVTSAAQVSAMAVLCERLEAAYWLSHRQRLYFEVQVETPQAILGPDGAATIARCVHAAPGRLAGLHYGTYDYSASLGIAAGYQSMEHPAADYARAVMQVAAAGTGVRLSDGSTNVLPGRRPRGRSSPPGGCTPGWCGGRWNAGSTRAGTCTRRSWSAATRPPTPSTATGLAAACSAAPRLHVPAPRFGQEEPATARALAGFLIRGLDCGAFTEPEIAGLTGLTRGT